MLTSMFHTLMPDATAVYKLTVRGLLTMYLPPPQFVIPPVANSSGERSSSGGHVTNDSPRGKTFVAATGQREISYAVHELQEEEQAEQMQLAVLVSNPGLCQIRILANNVAYMLQGVSVRHSSTKQCRRRIQ
jgi:hypothetical protein